MALNAAQVRDTWNLARLKGDLSLGTTFSKADLDAAVTAIDAWATTNQASFLAALPDPFKTSSNAAQKTLLFAYVVMKRGGVI